MCVLETSTLGYMAMAALGGKTILDAAGSRQAAEAQNRMLEYNAAASEQNAAYAQAEADYARDTAWSNAGEKRREYARLIGAQRAKMGASGAAADSGSFLDLSLDTRERGELDAFALLREGDNAAWRAEVQRDNYLSSAEQYRAGKTSPGAALTGSLLSGALNLGTTYFGLQRGGVFAKAAPGLAVTPAYDREKALALTGRL